MQSPRLALVSFAFAVTVALAMPARAEPPACNDAVMLRRVDTYYRFSDDQKGGGFQSLKDVKETGTSKEARNYHKYLTTTAHIDGVRYCEATAVLAGGKTDTVYYRIPDQVDGDKHNYDPDICSPRIFSFLGECEDFRPERCAVRSAERECSYLEAGLRPSHAGEDSILAKCRLSRCSNLLAAIRSGAISRKSSATRGCGRS